MPNFHQNRVTTEPSLPTEVDNFSIETKINIILSLQIVTTFLICVFLLRLCCIKSKRLNGETRKEQIARILEDF